jgi:hypothetical protein
MRPQQHMTLDRKLDAAPMNMDFSKPSPSMQPGATAGDAPAEQSLAGTVSALRAEVHQLRADLEQARVERNRALDVQKRLMDLLGTKSPEQIVHDVRNVMNERELFKALAETAG